MKHEPGIFEEYDEEAIAAADARARADMAAGRCYPHELVGEWLRTWGTPECRPFKEWLAARNG